MGGPRRGKVTVVNGVRFRSKFEADVAADLSARGIPFAHESVRLLYDTPRLYIPDFTFEGRLGIFHVESKGYFPLEDRRKMLEIKRSNPEVDVRIVFQNASTKLSRAKGSITYAQWADRNGFRWAEGTIPVWWTRGVDDAE